MKPLSIIPSALLALLASIAALSAPGQIRPSLTLSWDPPPPSAAVSLTCVYSSSNLLSWSLFTNTPPSVTNILIPTSSAASYFAITHSNIWGESPFSDAVLAPAQATRPSSPP